MISKTAKPSTNIQILTLLAAGQLLTRSDLAKSLGLTSQMIAPTLTDLVDFGQLNAIHHPRSALYSITEEGREELASFRRRTRPLEQPVICRTPIRLIEAFSGSYRPTTGAHYRNNGNKHIPSKGF